MFPFIITADTLNFTFSLESGWSCWLPLLSVIDTEITLSKESTSVTRLQRERDKNHDLA